MATHSSALAWRIPGMAEPGGLPSMGSHRVGHDWSDLAAAAATGYILLNRILVYIVYYNVCVLVIYLTPLLKCGQKYFISLYIILILLIWWFTEQNFNNYKVWFINFTLNRWYFGINSNISLASLTFQLFLLIFKFYSFYFIFRPMI